MFARIKAIPTTLKLLSLILLLFISGTLILARRKAPDPIANASVQQDRRPADQLEAELVTITPNGFEPGEITRPQGKFILAVDNRSGLNEVQLYVEGETGARLASTLTRKRKLAWRDVIDFPPGTYLLRAANDENWRCRITLTAR